MQRTAPRAAADAERSTARRDHPSKWRLFESRRLNRWLTPLNVALLIGLVLVVYELNQNRSLARMELVNEGNVVQNQIWANLMGELPGEVIGKALECPEEMTYADFMAMDAFLFTSMNTLYRNYELAQEGIFAAEEWRESVKTYANWFLANPFGRAWWTEEARSFFPSEFACHVDEQVASAEGRHRRPTSNLRRRDGSRAPVALGEHYFGPEQVSVRLQWRGGPNTVDQVREQFGVIGGSILADTAGGRDELRELVHPVLRDIVDRLPSVDPSLARSVPSHVIHLGARVL